MSDDRMTAADWRKMHGQPPPGADRRSAAGAASASPPKSVFDKMNKTEAMYANLLEQLLASKSIRGWRYQAVTLVLADGVRYTPDFLVEEWEGPAQLHEVKGFWRDDARVKFRVAAESFQMFRFFSAELERSEWVIREQPAGVSSRIPRRI